MAWDGSLTIGKKRRTMQKVVNKNKVEINNPVHAKPEKEISRHKRKGHQKDENEDELQQVVTVFQTVSSAPWKGIT